MKLVSSKFICIAQNRFNDFCGTVRWCPFLPRQFGVESQHVMVAVRPKKSVGFPTYYSVRSRGLEPPCLSTLEPESSASAISPRARDRNEGLLSPPRCRGQGKPAEDREAH